MATLKITGLTMNQAQVLAEWYEGQGEQDATVWFEENGNGEDSPNADVHHKGGCIKVDKQNEEVTLYCK